MKKYLWIALCVILLWIDFFLVMELKRLKRYSHLNNGSMGEVYGEMGIPNHHGLLNLIVYFSENSCIECMQESYYWNKLFLDLSRDELNIVGIIPENENIQIIKDRYGILLK